MRCEKWAAFVAAGLLMALNHGTARAADYPFCMTVADGWGGAIERCEYTTMQQCQASTGGLNGSCAPNWRLAFRNEGADTRGRSQVQDNRIRR